MPSLDQLNRLLETDPGDAFLLFGVAMEHAKLADHDTALSFFDRALEADPDNPYHYFHKARSLEALARVSDARGTLTSGLKTAQRVNDAKASGEISEFLSQLGE